MTWLGKILTFVVLIGSVVWAYFTVQAFATRSNWKADRDRYKAATQDWEQAFRTEVSRSQAREDALKRLLVNEKVTTDSLAKRVADLEAKAETRTKEFKSLQTEYEKGDVKATIQATNIDNTLKELDTVRKRNTDLEDDRLKLVIAREDAQRDKVRAENAAKLAQAVADENLKKAETLTEQLAQARASGGKGGLQDRLNKIPPPTPENLRGEVSRVAGDLVHLTVGIDAGVSKGTTLDLIRLDGGGKFVGTVKVIDVYPKEAVAVFTPSRAGVPFDRLRPEELPKKGDEVRPPNQ